MSYSLTVDDLAEADIDGAARWYRASDPDLGADFVRAVAAALAAIQQNPYQYQIIYRTVRRAGLRRFPYGLMYIVADAQIIVVACMHGRRDPQAWRERI